MNVSFTFLGGDEALEKKFSVEAQWVNFFTFAGHRSVDGCLVMLHLALPVETALVVFGNGLCMTCLLRTGQSHGLASQQTMVIPLLPCAW